MATVKQLIIIALLTDGIVYLVKPAAWFDDAGKKVENHPLVPWWATGILVAASASVFLG